MLKKKKKFKFNLLNIYYYNNKIIFLNLKSQIQINIYYLPSLLDCFNAYF